MKTHYADWNEFKASKLKLDMSRGKPSPEQLALSQALLDDPSYTGALAQDGTDCRNYGALLGIPEARRLFAELLGVSADETVVAGNSSLALFHDSIVFLMLHGAPGSPPWRDQGPVKFICPVPGYDRHFSICERLGIHMLPVPLLANGPDMDEVERLVAGDPSIKGMWCMPKYSNPTGAIYSAEAARRLAGMPAAAPDFRLFWDDAYRFHHLTEERVATPDILAVCKERGVPDRPILFMSTSKMTFASGGVAALASSAGNVRWWEKHLSIQTIGPDKLNQLRHVRFLRDRSGVEAHMDRHRALLRPKFDAVQRVLDALLGGIPGVSWTHPKGGYFIDLVTPPGMARRTVELARSAGLTLTPAGASFPYRQDSNDQHIRVAPSYPSLEEIELAAEGIALALLQVTAAHAAA